MTATHYGTQMEKQHGLCDLCGKKMKKPHLDHARRCCSVTSRQSHKFMLRGLLCAPCEATLIKVERTVHRNPTLKSGNDWLSKAHRYIWRWHHNHILHPTVYATAH